MKRLLAIPALAMLSACATPSDQIQATYVNPSAYAGLNCASLNAQAVSLNSRLQSAIGAQDQAASNDSTAMAISLVLFWPAAFFIKGNDNGPELARLRGEAEAIQSAASARGC